MEVLTLWPFSQGEMAGVREGVVDALFRKQVKWPAGKPIASRRDLFETVLAGSYPPVTSRRSGARRRAWFQSYLMTILQRDVRDLANISDLTSVPRLLALDRKSTRLNSSHTVISYAVFCLKKKIRCSTESSCRHASCCVLRSAARAGDGWIPAVLTADASSARELFASTTRPAAHGTIWQTV